MLIPVPPASEDSMLFRSIEQVRRVFRILGGFTLLVVGVIMFLTPGPGWVVIFFGLTLLAAEFVWAQRLMDRIRHEGNRIKSTVLKIGRN
jgi:uncharacterized protein (TIGR02611 family)